MRFLRDRPDILTPVVWYIVPRDRPELGVETIFGNRSWEWELVGDSLGDVPQGPGQWYGGAAPVPAAGCGLVGTPEQWLHGCLSTDPLPPLDPVTGAPAACCGRRYLGMGGAGVGAGVRDTNFIVQEDRSRIVQEDRSGIIWR